jgi:peptidoglycan/LPS O-acetylase OafA/YrhL
MPKPQMFLNTLTSLRGIAAMLVVFFHLNIIWLPFAQKSGFFWVEKGYLMVDFFFILSGFIMVHVYGGVFSGPWSAGDFWRFLRARFARIYPLHLFSLLLLLVLAWYMFRDKPMDPFSTMVYSPNAIPFHLLLLQGMHVLPFLSWNFPSWSISTEWWTYLFFPFLMWLYRRPSGVGGLALLSAGVLGYGLVNWILYPLHVQESPFPVSPGYSLDVTYDYGFFRCLAGFLLGMWAYLVCATEGLRRWFSSSWTWLGGVVALGAVLQTGMADWVVLPVFLWLLWASVFGEGYSRRILESQPLIFLGDISYSIYMLHGPLLIFVAFLEARFPAFGAGPFKTEIRLLGYFLVLILASRASYLWLEKPARNFLRSRSS